MPLIDRRKNKKKRLAQRAKKAHDRAISRGDTPIGTRKGPSSPRTLTAGTLNVYKREQKLLDKASKISVKDKPPKLSLSGRIKEALTFSGRNKIRRSKETKAREKVIRVGRRKKEKRKHISCKPGEIC